MGYDSFMTAIGSSRGGDAAGHGADWASAGLPPAGPRRIDDRTEVGAGDGLKPQ